MTTQPRAQWLAGIVLALTGLALLGLLGRVAWLQRHVSAAQLAAIERQNTVVRHPAGASGTIMGRDGTPYACSVRMYNLFADPGLIVDPSGKLNALSGPELKQARKQLAEALSPLLGKSPREVEKQIESNAMYSGGKLKRFLWLAKEVDHDFYDRFTKLKADLAEQSKLAAKGKDAAKARVLAHTLDGVGFMQSTKRMYPLGVFASQVIGFGHDQGIQGLENQLNDIIRARSGTLVEVKEKDSHRHTLWIKDEGYRAPDDGHDVWLTLDTTVQGVAEEELANACVNYKAESGCAVVMDPFSGKILAMANWPSFDPKDYAKTDPRLMRNKSVTDPYEPGSVFKVFVASWAIENHLVKPTDVFNCHFGVYYDPTGRCVKDDEGYGALTLEDVLAKSSNIGMTQVGWRLGIPAMYKGIRTFGFGSTTGVELPGDQKGLVTPLPKWTHGTLTSVSFGYEVAATPLQLIRGFATLANGGYLITPRVVESVEDTPGHAVPWADVIGEAPRARILSESTCLTMRTMLEQVLERGTGKKARSDVYRLFGKTGTAHLAIKGAGHYASDQYNSSFVCAGPFESPRLVALVTIHKPDRSLGHFGGTVAAPACTKIIERSLNYLQVPSDQVPRKKPAENLANF